jgi:hypothetical protein
MLGLLLVLLAVPLGIEAQPSGKVYRVGVLASSTEANFEASVKVFREALHAAGWIEGRNLTLDVRYPGDQYSRLQEQSTGEMNEVTGFDRTECERALVQEGSVMRPSLPHRRTGRTPPTVYRRGHGIVGSPRLYGCGASPRSEAGGTLRRQTLHLHAP